MEYAQAGWNPWSQEDIQLLEQVQHRFTRQVSGMGSLPYEERLKRLGLTTPQARRERGDMIETYKILTGKVDVEPTLGSLRCQHQEHKWVPEPGQEEIQVGCQKQLQFSCRVVHLWNALPDIVKN